MSIGNQIKQAASAALESLYGFAVPAREITVTQTVADFEGDYTIVLFALLKRIGRPPQVAGQELGEKLVAAYPDLFRGFNVVKGFLNLGIAEFRLTSFLDLEFENRLFGRKPANGKRLMVEYSSPNTNKPLHLGHLRNNFLGWSVAQIATAEGYDVIRTCIVNDRGIHISKSMIAWKMFAGGATPRSTGIKGDHLVGDYYVRFNTEYKKETSELKANGMPEAEAEKKAPILLAAQQMLVDWEKGDPETIALWEKMNSWVYAGFDETYRLIGSRFDKVYYESQTYILGNELVDLGIRKGVFFRKEDGSVWIDLTADGLDQKLVRRKDGTSVYITQDIGLAEKRQEEFGSEGTIYVVGDEQNYHFRVLRLICEKLELPAARGLHHLSYGMVELPTGKMKSREGTVVDADDLVAKMIGIAAVKTQELGKVNDFSPEELERLYSVIGLGALKYFLLRVDPKKKMVFNPEESIDFHGFTGPFIQYTRARISSILRKESTVTNAAEPVYSPLLALESALLLKLEQFPDAISEAHRELDPSRVALYVFDLARLFNSFYAQHSVAQAESPEKARLRRRICMLTRQVIDTSLELLGIEAPERM